MAPAVPMITSTIGKVNFHSVNRPSYKATFIPLAYLFISVASVGYAQPIVARHGTFAAYYYQPDYFIAATESRGGIKNTTDYVDTLCKIRVFDKKVLSFQEGYTLTDIDGLRTAFQDAKEKTADAVGRAWANTMPRHFIDTFRGIETDIYYHFADHTVADAFFADETGGKVGARRIRLWANSLQPFQISSQFIVLEPSTDIETGRTNPVFTALTREFLAKESDRARVANRQISGQTEVEREAVRLEALVNFIVKYSRDAGVGGDAQVALIERGKGARWIHRPNYCPEQ
jgi:hypothetical protein